MIYLTKYEYEKVRDFDYAFETSIGYIFLFTVIFQFQCVFVCLLLISFGLFINISFLLAYHCLCDFVVYSLITFISICSLSYFWLVMYFSLSFFFSFFLFLLPLLPLPLPFCFLPGLLCRALPAPYDLTGLTCCVTWRLPGWVAVQSWNEWGVWRWRGNSVHEVCGFGISFVCFVGFAVLIPGIVPFE